VFVIDGRSYSLDKDVDTSYSTSTQYLQNGYGTITASVASLGGRTSRKAYGYSAKNIQRNCQI
jgi:hypothetical protein